MVTLNISELKQEFAEELLKRRCSNTTFSYSLERNGPEALYGLTGAVNIMDALGTLPQSREQRTEAADRILALRGRDGLFDGGSGPGHAAHMVIGVLNMLGEPIPRDIAPLAPTEPPELSTWLKKHDWTSTHKELCGGTIPLLASGSVSAQWIEVFVYNIASRLNPNHPLETWCEPDAPAKNVISCIFHVLSAFDAGRLPYPQPEMLIQRLFNLEWEHAHDNVPRTFCTDGDWALVLLNLCKQLPHHYEQAISAIRRVSSRRVKAWYEQRELILGDDTHDLYCYLWSTAVFQSCVRDHYSVGYIRDTFNDPALFRR